MQHSFSNAEASCSKAWSWFEDDDQTKPKYHELQTVIDTLAYAENIGVGLLDWQALDAFDIGEVLSNKIKAENNRSQYEALLQRFCSEIFEDNVSDFEPLVSEGTPYQWMADQERKIWLTLPGNPLPIHALFRMNKEWCWFIFIWFYTQRNNIRACADHDSSLDAFGIGVWELQCCWVTLIPGQDRRHMLVFGPNYKAPLTNEPRDFSRTEGQRIIECFRRFYELACDKSRTGLSDEPLMQRMLLSRLPLPTEEIAKRIDNVKRIFQTITDSLAPNTPYRYRCSDFLTLVRSYISVFRANNHLCGLARNTESSSLYFPLLAWESDGSNVPQTTSTFFRLDVHWKKVELCCTSGVWPVIKEGLLQQGENPYLIIVNKHGERCDYDITRVNCHISRWNERISIRRRFFQNLCGDMLLSWMRDHLGELLEESQNANELYHHICGAIADDLRADLCHLYRYKHHDDSVILLGGAYRHDSYRIHKDALREQMEKISAAQKERSAVYRCIREEKLTNNETAQYDDGQEVFLRDGLPDAVQTQSGLVTPIFHMGRIYGVIETSGCIPYQFSWTHQYTLSNLESILGEYLYQQHLLFSLKEITRLALDKSQNPEQLCRVLSDIFLCKDASILLNNKIHTGAYTLYGSTQSEIFAGQTRDMLDDILVEGKTGCLAKLREKYISRGENYVTLDNPETEEFADEPFAKNLREKGLKYNVTFALTRSGSGQSEADKRRPENLLGAVMLHHDKPWKEHKKWRSIIHIINGQLVVALDMLNALYDEQQNDQLLLRHEIMQSCKVLQEIPDNVRATLNGLLSWRNERDKQIRGYRAPDDVTPLEVRYQSLANSFYSKLGGDSGRDVYKDNTKHICLPALDDLNKRLNNIGFRAKVLKETVSIYESVRQGGGGKMGDLFGVAPDLELLVEKLDLRTVVLDIYQGHRKKFDAKGIYVDFSGVSIGFCLKDVNLQMINRWISNMMDNACKYSLDDRSYTIKLEPRKDNNYRFIFENQGRPLTAQEAKSPNSLFARGTKAAEARKTEKGEGFGLFAVREICNHLNIGYGLEYRYITPSSAMYRFVFTIPASLITLENMAKSLLGYR